jgi:Uma2 family endonuclease
MSQIDVGTATVLGSIPIVTPPIPPTNASLHLRPFTVDEYHRLGEAGIFGGDERLELLEGIITMMAPVGLLHGQGVFKVLKLLERTLPAGWQAVSQQSITLPDSEPVPDVIVLRGDLLQYSKLPQPHDLGLLVEVADSSLRQDRLAKVRIYAAAGIAEYWIVNLVDRKVEIRRLPRAASDEQPARYESVEVLGPEAAVNAVLDGTQVGTIHVRDILP